MTTDAQPFYSTFKDADVKGWVENKKFSDVETLARSYKHAETLLGVPAERRLTLPEKMDDPEAMGPIYNRLGRPEKPDGYAFSTGDEFTKNLAQWGAERFHKLGLTKAQADGIFSELVGLHTSEDAAAAEASKKDEEALRTEWGQEFDKRMNIAAQAVDKLGLDGAGVTSLADKLGEAAVARLLFTVGSKITEPPFVDGKGAPGNKHVGSADAAKQRKSALMEDEGFVKRYIAGDAAARDEMLQLNIRIAGG